MTIGKLLRRKSAKMLGGKSRWTHGGVAILPYPGDKLGLDGPFRLSK